MESRIPHSIGHPRLLGRGRLTAGGRALHPCGSTDWISLPDRRPEHEAATPPITAAEASSRQLPLRPISDEAVDRFAWEHEPSQGVRRRPPAPTS